MTCVWILVSAVVVMLSSNGSNGNNKNFALAFAPIVSSSRSRTTTVTSAPLKAEEGGSGSSTSSVVNQVTGEELEMMMQEWEQPLVVDAYATVSIQSLFHSSNVCLCVCVEWSYSTARNCRQGRSSERNVMLTHAHLSLSVHIFKRSIV